MPVCPKRWCAIWCSTKLRLLPPLLCTMCCWIFWPPRCRRSCCPPRTARLHRSPRTWWPLRAARFLPVLCAALRFWPGKNLPAGKGGLCRQGRVHGCRAVQVAAQLLLALFCSAVQAQLPAGRPQGGQRDPFAPGDWRMPSDACATLWLAELEQLKPGSSKP